MEFYIAQGISIISGIFAIIMMQQKNMRTILIFQIIVNLTASLNYLILGGNSGAILSIIAIVHLIVMFLYNKKEKAPHLITVLAFMAAYLASSVYNVIALSDLRELLPAAAAVCFWRRIRVYL